MAPTNQIRLLGAVLASCLVGCAQRLEMPIPAPLEDPSEEWAALLTDAADDAGVDYQLIAAHRDVLERYLAWAGEHGELSDGWKESKEDQRIAYLLNVYNAAVIYGVLEHQPLDSVRDVGVGMLRYEGAGFFVGLRFRVDGEWTNLHSLENQRIINRYQEPLVHVALSCASASCPPVKWWEARGLQSRLRTAMRRFLASDRGLVAIAPAAGSDEPTAYAANQIFAWYAADFIDWSQATTVCEWMSEFATGDKRDWLERHAEDCPLEYQDYDWSLNAALPAERPGETPGERPAKRPADSAEDEGAEDEGAEPVDSDTGDEAE